MRTTVERRDFESAYPELERLLQYRNAFAESDLDWSRLANQGDFEVIYNLENSTKIAFEEIYAIGREFAGAMVTMIEKLEDVREHPTLTSFINRFNNTWVEQTDLLEERVKTAKDLLSKSPRKPWTIGQMIRLFEMQIGLLKAVKTTLSSMKHSEIYKRENGFPPTKQDQPHINIGSFQGVWGNIERSTVSQDFSRNIKKDNFPSLAKQLESIGISESDLADLKKILATEPPNNDKTTGPQLSSWIGKMISKSANGSWKFSLSTASGVLSKAIATYFGW